MEVVITSLDALIQKATNASLERPDPAAVEAFCTVLSDSPNGAYVATRVIASRIRSNHPAEALLALEVLDVCMKRCDVSFRVEVDKFRFLNEMIKLVSPKYYGNKTAPAVKQKVLNLMHSWTVEYPRELKIRDAFEMLKKQGVVKDIPTPPPPPKDEVQLTPKPRNKDGIFEDEEKARLLQKLLQSKNPEDIQAANRLIKTMVKEDERRVEAVSRRITELQTVHNNARLLDEMLDQYKPGVSSAEDLDLIKELHGACLRLRPTVFKLAAETQHNEEMLNDVLEASDELTQVFNKYTAVVSQGNTSKDQSDATRAASDSSDSAVLNGDSLLDLNSTSSTSSEHGGVTATSNLEVLGDIFSSVNITSCNSETMPSNILKPISLIPQSSNENKVSTPQAASKGFSVLDELGAELLKASGGPSSSKLGMHFSGKQSDKTPMNLLAKTQAMPDSKIKDSVDKEQIQGSNTLDLDFLISNTLNKESHSGSRYSESHSTDDDFMVDLSSDESSQKTKLKTISSDDQEISVLEYLKGLKSDADKQESKFEEQITKEPKTPEEEHPKESNGADTKVNSVSSPTKTSPEQPQSSKSNICEVKSLTDIKISLENITPGDKPPVIAFEESDGISVILHFTKNKPRPDVSVIVLSTTSKNKHPIQDFKFHAVVPKGCKVRLLPPSGECFPAFTPFLPPAAITQVMLIAHPPGASIFLKFVITYTCEDDSISEMGEVSQLPLDNDI